LRVIDVPSGDDLVAAVVRAIDEQGPDAIVVGLPLNMDGSEGAQAKRARAFGRRLGERTQIPIHYQDERLTSFAAEARLAGSGHTHQQKKERRDALAAAEILRDYLDKKN
jgi:putative Holliday junction resolvase